MRRHEWRPFYFCFRKICVARDPTVLSSTHQTFFNLQPSIIHLASYLQPHSLYTFNFASFDHTKKSNIPTMSAQHRIEDDDLELYGGKSPTPKRPSSSPYPQTSNQPANPLFLEIVMFPHSRLDIDNEDGGELLDPDFQKDATDERDEGAVANALGDEDVAAAAVNQVSRGVPPPSFVPEAPLGSTSIWSALILDY